MKYFFYDKAIKIKNENENENQKNNNNSKKIEHVRNYNFLSFKQMDNIVIYQSLKNKNIKKKQ
tara:strand:+ start:109 stop:297 length:189 start_codon:yes stop_codon:yes gene_type:complete